MWLSLSERDTNNSLNVTTSAHFKWELILYLPLCVAPKNLFKDKLLLCMSECSSIFKSGVLSKGIKRKKKKQRKDRDGLFKGTNNR